MYWILTERHHSAPSARTQRAYAALCIHGALGNVPTSLLVAEHHWNRYFERSISAVRTPVWLPFKLR